MPRVKGKLSLGSGTGQTWKMGTPEHALLILVLAEVAILIGLRNLFRSAHGG